MIKINGVTKKFENTVAVNNLSLEIGPGVTGLVGHNGAGKTTLLRLISDVYLPNSGEIIIDGVSNHSIAAKADVFFLSDNPYYERNFTIKDVFEFYGMFYQINEKKFNRLVAKFELPRDRKITGFSKGMKRQLFIALTLSINCKHLLMDEAFDGIDPMTIESIKEEIIKLAQKEEKTVVISSHNIALIERLCDKLVVLDKGEIGKNGDMEDIGTDYYKYQCFFNTPVSREFLEGLGIKVVYFKQNGSLINFVSNGPVDEKMIKEKIDTVLFENVAISGEELITIEMVSARENAQMRAKKEEEDDDE